jgi:two-component system chemotaxis response regulator CheY
MTKPKSILIAEDDAHIALALKMIVRKAVAGAQVTVVADGRQALEKLKQGNYDLLISDWNMPELTGMELLTELRADDKIAPLPFLMLTARTDLASVKEVLEAEQADYISKPFDNEEVIEKVLQLLG